MYYSCNAGQCTFYDECLSERISLESYTVGSTKNEDVFIEFTRSPRISGVSGISPGFWGENLGFFS
jgi:hypothetical protein